jgi:hypothetical protein
MGKVKVERRQRLLDICKHIVANPRDVDDETKAALKAATMKYAHTQYDEPTRVLKAFYRDDGELGSLLRKAVEVCECDDDDDRGNGDDTEREHNDNGDNGDDGEADTEKRADISQLADLLLEGGQFTDRAHALRFLLHNKDGVALARMHKRKEAPAMKSHSEFVSDVVKTYGFVALAKSGVQDQKSYGLDGPAAARL